MFMNDWQVLQDWTEPSQIICMLAMNWFHKWRQLMQLLELCSMRMDRAWLAVTALSTQQ